MEENPSNLGPPISDLIQNVRTEIEKCKMKLAESEREGILKLDSVEVETKFIVENTGSVQSGVNWMIFAVGANADFKNGHVHSMKFILKPDNGDVIAGKSVT